MAKLDGGDESDAEEEGFLWLLTPLPLALALPFEEEGKEEVWAGEVCDVVEKLDA